MSEKKKEYIITDLGKTVFAEEIKRLSELLHNGQLMWRTVDGNPEEPEQNSQVRNE